MRAFAVACLCAWVFTAFTEPIPRRAPHLHDPGDLMTPTLLNEGAPLIVGGRPAEPNEFPYQVSLQIREKAQWNHICGGVVVAEDKVVTAAHCIYGSNHSRLRVVAGEHNLTQDDGTEQVSGIDAAIWHPNYNPRTLDYDYGVLRLTSNLSFNEFVKNISMPFEDFLPSEDCSSNGWGNTLGDGNWLLPSVLFTVTLPFVSRPNCSQMYEGVGKITERMVCAGDGGRGGCHGDSGGPLVCNGYFTGIVSWGEFPCAQKEFPTVFSSTAAGREWILLQ